MYIKTMFATLIQDFKESPAVFIFLMIVFWTMGVAHYLAAGTRNGVVLALHIILAPVLVKIFIILWQRWSSHKEKDIECFVMGRVFLSVIYAVPILIGRTSSLMVILLT